MYPKTVIEALNQIKANVDHGFLDFAIDRECYGANPYLSGLTDQGWVILWSVDMLDQSTN